jgi:hypothetical protein
MIVNSFSVSLQIIHIFNVWLSFIKDFVNVDENGLDKQGGMIYNKKD